jgi:hypothetical protein
MNLWPAFEKVWAPEEVYFPTALNICGLMDEVITRSVTHSKWNEKAANLKDRAHPICYDGYFDDDVYFIVIQTEFYKLLEVVLTPFPGRTKRKRMKNKIKLVCT